MATRLLEKRVTAAVHGKCSKTPAASQSCSSRFPLTSAIDENDRLRQGSVAEGANGTFAVIGQFGKPRQHVIGQHVIALQLPTDQSRVEELTSGRPAQRVASACQAGQQLGHDVRPTANRAAGIKRDGSYSYDNDRHLPIFKKIKIMRF